jgi:hypothetical protein
MRGEEKERGNERIREGEGMWKRGTGRGARSERSGLAGRPRGARGGGGVCAAGEGGG